MWDLSKTKQLFVRLATKEQLLGRPVKKGTAAYETCQRRNQLLVRLSKKEQLLLSLNKNERLLVRLVEEGTAACETCF